MFVDRLLWANPSFIVGLQNPCLKRKNNLIFFSPPLLYKKNQNVCLKNDVDSFIAHGDNRKKKNLSVRYLSEMRTSRTLKKALKILKVCEGEEGVAKVFLTV